ncbi:MAG: hypothetical protein U0359_06525 [Byssovorax sp.]
MLRSLTTLALTGALVLPLAGCSALTRADEITISAESFAKPAAAAPAAQQPIPLPGGGARPAAPSTGG